MRSAVLGVKAADNLRHAELVLLVEGEEDRTALLALCRAHSPLVRAAIDQATLAIDTLAGASNLPYKLGLIRDSLCIAHVFLDDDAAGRAAFERARTEGLIGEADVNFATCDGMLEAELEDLYNPNVYAPLLANAYRVTLDSPRFKTADKWSVRMRDVFKQQGKTWKPRLERETKARVAEAVAADPSNALLTPRRAPFDALMRVLGERLQEAKTKRTTG